MEVEYYLPEVVEAEIALDEWLLNQIKDKLKKQIGKKISEKVTGKKSENRLKDMIFEDPFTTSKKIEKRKKEEGKKIVQVFRSSIKKLLGSNDKAPIIFRYSRARLNNAGTKGREFINAVSNDNGTIQELMTIVGLEYINENKHIDINDIYNIISSDENKKIKLLDYIKDNHYPYMPETIRLNKEFKEKDIKKKDDKGSEGTVPATGDSSSDKNTDKKTDKKPSMWAPMLSMGGQGNLLSITDTEKIEELKNWTLYDLVNPLLQADPDNLLAAQNKIQEARRFYNTYPNPQPQPNPMMYPTPRYIDTWQYPMQNVLPTPYPMRVSNLENGSNNYYKYFGDQTRQDLDYRKDLNNSVTNPDFSQIANSQRSGFTATNNQSMKHAPGTKVSLIEGLNPNDLRDVDFMSRL